jgi:hypothetical protein
MIWARRGQLGDRRSPARAATVAALGAVAFAGATACGHSDKHSTDAALDVPATGDAPASDGNPRPVALDFSATGCSSYDSFNARCDGNAPLTVVFTPIASPELTRFLWDFGDGSVPSSDRSPSHTYALPDLVDSGISAYDVTLVAAGSTGGTVSRTHAHYVNVIPASIGEPCDVDQQCAPGLDCVCGSASPCRPVLARGICTRSCGPGADAATCTDTTICVDLSNPPIGSTDGGATKTSSTTGSTDAGAADAGAADAGAVNADAPGAQNDDWRRPLCLPMCPEAGTCAGGFACRQLLALAPASGWAGVCFASYPLAVGERCGDATGRPLDADCASGLCADLGAFGRCSADCGSVACPTGSACAHFGDGSALCLATCAGASSCSDDPLLGCEAPGAPGTLGFTIAADADGAQPAATATYCAPKLCTTAADCGAAGACPAGGGHCTRLN